MLKRIVLPVLLTMMVVCTFPAMAARRVVIDGYTFISTKTVATAIRYLRAGLWKEAEEELQRRVIQRPNDHTAIYDLGLIRERLGHKQDAERLYLQAISLRLTQTYAQALGRVRGTLTKGANLYHWLFRCKGHCQYGRIYASAGLWREALNEFETAFQSNARDSVSCYHIAVAHEALGHRSKATKYCKLAISLRSNQKFIDFLAYLKTAPPPRSTHPTQSRHNGGTTPQTELKVKTYFYVKTDSANLRSQPTEASDRICILNRGSRVGLLGSLGDWYRVRTYDRKEGWIHKRLLGKTIEEAWGSEPKISSGPPPEAPESPRQTDKAPSEREKMRVIDSGAEVAVRAEPSLLADVIYSFKPGDIVEIINKGRSNWLFVSTPKGPGYVLSGYLEPLSP